MSIVLARREFVRAWKAWRKSRAIRSAMHKAGYGRSGPVKAWYDECTVMMRRARRAVMMELRKPKRVWRLKDYRAYPDEPWEAAFIRMLEMQNGLMPRGSSWETKRA